MHELYTCHSHLIFMVSISFNSANFIKNVSIAVFSTMSSTCHILCSMRISRRDGSHSNEGHSTKLFRTFCDLKHVWQIWSQAPPRHEVTRQFKDRAKQSTRTPWQYAGLVEQENYRIGQEEYNDR